MLMNTLIQLKHPATSNAENFKLQHGDKVDFWFNGDKCFICLKKNAKIMIPKAVQFDWLAPCQI
ncbi:hypothetical protein VP01_14059g1 [Puccinia sorghi]|uniref:Uncharacterized protein n=1 Tax=Puccinia sorghi TaxID=27349 RepID=A0A0L6VLH0_9BASI|nr:hypothetical protein VP01_14059g1 [Puccinia sorghi]